MLALRAYKCNIKSRFDGKQWIATYRHGVFCYDGKQLKHFPIMDGASAVKLFTVYIDRAGTAWLGTHADGAYRFNGTSFERFMPPPK